MHATHWTTKSVATLATAIAVALAPGLARADHDHDRGHDRDHQRREQRDERRSDSRFERRGDNRSERHHRDDRDVRYVEVRRPAPRFTIGFQVGNAPYCAPVRAYCPPPAPVYYSNDACGAYYDPYCNTRFSNFELYIEHLSRSHAISVSVRN